MYITVFTPTYNRGYRIENLYRSLQRQTNKNFEWIVIDDGSKDNTKQLFDKWVKEENNFNIRYYKVKNGGKHRAINRGVELAKGKLFFIVDSDDYIIDDAIEKLIKWEKTIRNENEFCAISGNRGNKNNSIWGTTFEGKYIDGTYLERKKNNIDGDKAEVFYTDILKKYKFKEFENENFLTEATVWGEMAYDGYKIRWFNEIIYISEYLEDGLTNSGVEIFKNNPKGTAYTVKQKIKFEKSNFINKLSKYNEYYKIVNSMVTFEQAKNNLGISSFELGLAIFLVKCKDIILRR